MLMKTTISFLGAALIVVLGLTFINEAVLPNMLLDSRAGQSLEYFSATGTNGSSPDKVCFVKAIETFYPDAGSAARRSLPVVHPVSLERVAP